MNEQNQQPTETVKSDAALREEIVLKFWKEQDIFKKTLAKEVTSGDFIFYDGPPTANGMPGLHHVEPQSFKDAIPRYKTMRGFHVPRRAGWDTHGLPVELQVEKALGLKSKKEIEAYGIAAFNQKCKESVWMYKEEWMKMRKRMGYWTDMDHAYITYTNNYIEALWGVVAKASDRGHLYKDFKVVPWCTRCGTGLSSHELSQPGAYKDVKDLSVFVKFKVIGQENTYIVAWTTTPWTLPGNVALAVGNDISYAWLTKDGETLIVADERKEVLGEGYEVVKTGTGADLVGLTYEPLYPYLADLIPDKSLMGNAYKVYSANFVTTTDGTGVVHTAVMYGADDFDLGTALGLPKFHLVNEEGKFVAGTAFLEGRYVKESDENGKPTLAVDIINDLKERNLFFKQENIKHSYPHCWRCDTPLIYYARTSWYFRMSALREQLLAGNEQINWEPNHIKEGRFGEWLDGIKDWAISRDRYWGTPLPIWENEDGEKLVASSVAMLKEYGTPANNTYYVMRHGQTENNVKHIWNLDAKRADPLTEVGSSAARASAESLKDKKIDLIVVSPFARTQETAQIVAGVLGLSSEQLVTDERLSEWRIGADHDGRELNEFFVERNASADRYGYKTSDGESYVEVLKRSGDALYDLEEKYSGKNILIISHGAPTRALELIARGYSLPTLFEDTREYKNFDNAEVRALNFVSLPHNEQYELDLHRPYIDSVVLHKDGKEYRRTKEVMDVWFDSGAMPYAQAHQLGAPMDFTPIAADYISEAIDQTRGWFYTLHAVANLVSDEPRANYKNVICLGHILDANGQKMSKSKGNVVNPWDMFAKYGADTIRLWMYSVNQPGDSKNFDEKTVIETHRQVFGLLYNVLAFYELYRDTAVEKVVPTGEHVLDAWIATRLDQLTVVMTENLENFKLLEPVRALREFIDDLSTWYVRRNRDRIKDGDVNAKATLYVVLKTLAQLMAPFAPFTAEDIWQKLKTQSDAESVHLSTWPTSMPVSEELLRDMSVVREVCTAGNALRKKLAIPVRQPLAKLIAKEWNLGAEYAAIVMDELNVKEVVVGSETSLDTEITPALKLEGEYRELVRSIQDMRKDKGLAPQDSISLSLPEKYQEIVNMFGEEMKKTVGAKEVVVNGEEILIA